MRTRMDLACVPGIYHVIVKGQPFCLCGERATTAATVRLTLLIV